MRAARFTPDFREISAIVRRTALATFGRVLTVTIVLIVMMGVITGVLARAYHEAQRRGAALEFAKGEAAASAGRTTEALDHYGAALALEREDARHRRALALMLLRLRRTAEAETHLAQLLEHDPVDGEANLLLARLAASRSDFAGTEASYQRAIYGRWPAEGAARRLAARFELIEWLTQVGAPAPARAELLRLQAELPDVPFLQRELARRLFDLAQPAQAAAILQRELDRRPSDASVAADLARAEMAAGRFPEARAAARRALALDPYDRRTRNRLDRLTQALALDPAQRGLTAAARFRRSQRLLARAHADLDTCLDLGQQSQAQARQGQAPQGQTLPDDVTAARANAQRLLDDERASYQVNPVNQVQQVQQRSETRGATSEPTPAASLQGRTDARLAAAEALWSARVARCGASDVALAWIFDRLHR